MIARLPTTWIAVLRLLLALALLLPMPTASSAASAAQGAASAPSDRRASRVPIHVARAARRGRPEPGPAAHRRGRHLPAGGCGALLRSGRGCGADPEFTVD